MGIDEKDIEAELSYAFLHAIASRAGMICKVGNRHDDNTGVDATIRYVGPTAHPYITDVTIHVQLKATIRSKGSLPGHACYFLTGTNRYNKLRIKNSDIYTILMVLFLPPDRNEWLQCTVDELILKGSVYWACLYGAEETNNDTGLTIYLPLDNIITPHSLEELANLAAQKLIPEYQSPQNG